MLRLYNTLTRKREAFKPIEAGKVKMYSCGPTVYDFAHVGNLRAFVFVDILKRFLKYKGLKVKHVMNITDVDDKTIKKSKEQEKSLKEFCDFYEKSFLDDLKTLNVQIPDIMPRATEHVKEMIDIIEELKEKGLAYDKDGSVYFKISASKGYGKLAKLDADSLKTNADGRLSDEYEKDDARDFALWKAYSPDDGEVFWKNDLPKGRPGWHIECSAMSMKYLGRHFDIHTGGVDLIFPHHTNEIAQSEGATGKKFVNYWIHNAHLIVNGEKMSKKLGNFFTLRDLLAKGNNASAIRYELLSTHYRKELDFREKNLGEVQKTLLRFKELFVKLDNVKKGKDNAKASLLVKNVKKDFEKAMDDDLNIAKALSSIFIFIREIHKIVDTISSKDAQRVKQALIDFDSVLGVMDYKKTDIPSEIIALAEERMKAKNAKDWKKADSLREEIKKKGYQIDDTKDGYIIKKN